jgi:HK97 family phage major capsid protein
MDPRVLAAKKAEHKAAAIALNRQVAEAGRDMTETEVAQYDAHVREIKTIDAALQRFAELATFSADETIDNRGAVVLPVAGQEDEAVENPHASKEYSKAFFAYVRKGGNVSREVMAALNIGTSSAGGYATPVEFDTTLVEKLVNANVMRQISEVISTTSDRKILIENSVGSAAWTAEAGVAHNDDGSDDDSFAQVSLSAYKLTRIVKASEELLQDAFFDIQGWLARKYGNAFGIAEEAAFVNGAGSTLPTGVVRSASAGITAHLHNDIATDELFDFYHSLKRAYRANGSFLMNDSTALLLRKKKDGQGRYIWQEGLQAGQPDVLLGRPVYISDAMPTADTAGNKAVLFGDFKYYTIMDRTPRTFTRLNELYMANGQIGFRGVERTDGKLTLAEAVVALTMGAAS